MDLTEAIQITDEFARTQLGAESDATDFMTYIASAESNYGNYERGGMTQKWMDDALSYGPFQMDPIRYYDTVQDPNLGEVHKKRIDKVNKFLREKGYGEDFDISKIAVYDPEIDDYSSKSDQTTMHDPLINSFLTRLALMKDDKAAPTETNEMQDRYFEFWGPASKSDYKKSEANKKYLNVKRDLMSPLESIKTENKVSDKVFNLLEEKPLF